MLVDNFLGKSQNVRTNPSYDFNVTNDSLSIGNNRFILTIMRNKNLPVNYLNFWAKTNNKANTLIWQTINEINYKGFTVQRQSLSGSWETLSFINSKGLASIYTYEDTTPPTLGYYRLIQTDNNGLQNSSQVVIVQRDVPVTMRIAPNPTVDWVHISLPSTVANQIRTIRILSPLGNQIFQKTTKDAEASFNLSGLAKGIYIVEVELDGKIHRNKMVLE
jgi:hypothetical protein